jgi:hypothetical protein
VTSTLQVTARSPTTLEILPLQHLPLEQGNVQRRGTSVQPHNKKRKVTKKRHFSHMRKVQRRGRSATWQEKIGTENRHFSHMTRKDRYREEALQPQDKKRKLQRKGTSAIRQKKISIENRHFSGSATWQEKEVRRRGTSATWQENKSTEKWLERLRELNYEKIF